MNEKNYTVYVVQIRHGELQWDIEKRYREFRQLDDNLRGNTKLKSRIASELVARVRSRQGFPKLPGKAFGKLNYEKLELRRKALEQYLSELVKIPELSESVELLSFIGVLSTARNDVAATTGKDRSVISVSVLTEHAKPGDLILFRTKTLTGKLQRGFTRGGYDHVGIVVPSKRGNGKQCDLLESTGDGVTAFSLVPRLRAYAKEYTFYVALRRMQVKVAGYGARSLGTSMDVEPLVLVSTGGAAGVHNSGETGSPELEQQQTEAAMVLKLTNFRNDTQGLSYGLSAGKLLSMGASRASTGISGSFLAVNRTMTNLSSSGVAAVKLSGRRSLSRNSSNDSGGSSPEPWANEPPSPGFEDSIGPLPYLPQVSGDLRMRTSSQLSNQSLSSDNSEGWEGDDDDDDDDEGNGLQHMPGEGLKLSNFGLGFGGAKNTSKKQGEEAAGEEAGGEAAGGEEAGGGEAGAGRAAGEAGAGTLQRQDGCDGAGAGGKAGGESVGAGSVPHVVVGTPKGRMEHRKKLGRQRSTAIGLVNGVEGAAEESKMLETYFCSELVAAAMFRMDVLTSPPSSLAHFLPADFAQNGQIEKYLSEGVCYSDEIMIDFDTPEIEKAYVRSSAKGN
jgi:hypothetical protein